MLYKIYASDVQDLVVILKMAAVHLDTACHHAGSCKSESILDTSCSNYFQSI